MLLGKLLVWRAELPASVNRLLVGFSGGRDSQVLLHALCECERIAPRFTLRAVHVHHGIHPRANEWVMHCEQTCAAWEVPLSVVKLAWALSVGESVEDRARQMRYAAFTQTLFPNEVLVTAHHVEDQAETVLLQLLRGAGPKGLSGMPKWKPFHVGWHARPLLDHSRQTLEQYAHEQALDWVEDDSNQSVRFKRNFLRHRIMNILAKWDPTYATRFARSALHCADTERLLEKYLLDDLAKCVLERGGLSVAVLKQYCADRQRGIVRLWLVRQGCTLPSTKRLYTIVEQMVNASPQAKPSIHWGKWRVYRIREVVYVEENHAVAES